MGAVHAEIEHLLKESNIRNPGYFVHVGVGVGGVGVGAKTK